MTFMTTAKSMATLDAAIVGAGFAGLYMLHRLRELGFSARIYEAGSGVGGTWYWNRYPGARCDVESLEYSYTFSEELRKEWQWTERYAAQPEILRYLNHVADRFDLRRDIQFDTKIAVAVFNESEKQWLIETDGGDRVAATFCIMATGCLSAARVPDFEGLEIFQGKQYHTGHWPHEGVDFTGQRVAVIGTGSSGIQSIPVIAGQASQVYVFQRTPNFSVPAHNGPIAEDVKQDWQENGPKYRAIAESTPFGLLVQSKPAAHSALEVAAAERERVYEQGWQAGGFGMIAAFPDIVINRESNDTAAEFVRNKIRGIVRNPAVAEMLTPKDYPIATKRLCIDTGYFETYNRDNVTLIDARATPVEALTRTGLRTRDREFEVDSIVFATGFDAMTGALNGIEIRGRHGEALKEKWAAGPRTYLGLMAAGFPNLFTITGPGSPSVLSNMALSIEQHVEWIADCVAHLRDHGIATIEASAGAENEWLNHVNETAHQTLFPLANSWYMGANIPGKPRVFLPYIGGVPAYRQKCDEVAARGYEGFVLGERAARSPA
ncbi:MAG: NAD(P)/FAD-dependent oxidoreductase [Acidobacteriia bacterium]|nr:NAD(P)/FAD-dependent oxidoreductase [Terriglobia bacterium]